MRASVIVTYYIKLFRTGADRRNGILMPLLVLVAEIIKTSMTSMTSFKSLDFIPFSNIFIVDFEQLSVCWAKRKF